MRRTHISCGTNVYRSVINGAVAAGGGVLQTLNGEPAEVRSQLRVLYTTAAYRPHPIITHPRVAGQTRERFFAALSDLYATPEGQKMLAEIQIDQPVRVSYKSDYQPLENLGLDKFIVKERPQ